MDGTRHESPSIAALGSIMKNKLITILLLAVLATWPSYPQNVTPPPRSQRGAAQDLLEKALAHPNDENSVAPVIFAVRDTKDPEVISTLKKIFNATGTKYLRQTLAISLMRLGQSEDA